MISFTSIPVNFKEVFTTHVISLHLNPNWTVTQLLETVRPILAEEFNYEQQNFDIVATGQDSPGIPAEAGFSLKNSNQIIRQKWGPQLQISFYIRRTNVPYPQLQNLNNNLHTNLDINPIITNSFVEGQCPICFENTVMVNRYNCRHRTCNNCYYSCINNGYYTCPICRAV